jgi:Cof subfamily protein (haloacid dehalogenase superfamily)
MVLAGNKRNKPRRTIELSRMKTGLTFKISRLQLTSQYLIDRFIGKLRLKMVCLDLDGTALNDAKKIAPENLETIKKLKENKTAPMVNIVTGRGFHQAKRFAKEMGVKYFVTDNGGAIFEGKDGGYDLVKAYTMPEEDGRKIIDEICTYAQENPNMVYHLSTPDQFFIGKGSFQKAHDTFYSGEPFGDGVVEIESFNEISQRGLSDQIIKICVDFREGDIAEKQCKAFKDFLEKNRINYFPTTDTKFEIAPDDVNKARAILEIMKREMRKGRPIRNEEVAVFGDSENDLSMFELGFQSFAPVNTKPSIFRSAKSVIKLNMDNNGPFLREGLEDRFITKTTPVYKDIFEGVKAKIKNRGGEDRER